MRWQEGFWFINAVYFICASVRYLIGLLRTYNANRSRQMKGIPLDISSSKIHECCGEVFIVGFSVCFLYLLRFNFSCVMQYIWSIKSFVVECFTNINTSDDWPFCIKLCTCVVPVAARWEVTSTCNLTETLDQWHVFSHSS